MKFKPFHFLTLLKLCIFCVVLAIFVSELVFLRNEYFNPERDALAQAKLVSIVSALELGSEEAEVRKVIVKDQSGLLRFYVYEPSGAEKDGEWRILTPSKFGAGNWVAKLLFRDHSLYACIIRLHDSDHFKPRDAPPDRVREGYALPNEYRVTQEY